jgi:transposase
MDEPLAQLTAGTPVAVHLSDGSQHRGLVHVLGGGWMHLIAPAGGLLINLDQVVMIALAGPEPATPSPIDHPRPRPVSKDVPVKVGSRAPGRPWQDADLRVLADGFLEGATEADLSERFHRTRAQIKLLRQGFECARGTVMEDEINDVARTWIARWRRVLGGAG